MRSKRTNKVQSAVRLSYADRVLGAVVTIRREQKKRAIHINTLRAQVRKTAELQQNPLGPQWSTWVGRAVVKLETQGVLQEDHASGNICLTPRAKKALKDARRDSHARTPSTAQEEHLWKSINTQFLTPSTPSKRRRSSTHVTGDNDDHEHTMDTPTNHTKHSRKRHKGISGMNKAELRDELKRLRKVNQEAQTKLEAVTKNADRGAEDIERLNAELARREDEIEGVCLELDDFRNQSSATPGSSEYRSSEPPSSPTMHIVSTLPDDCHNTLPPIKKRTLLASHMDDGDESEDPFGPLDVGSNPNLFSEYTQQLSTGDSATPKPSELSTTLVSGDSEVLDQARKSISALEQQVTEKTEIARRAVLDRDSLGVVAASLREQLQSLETAMIAEKMAATGIKDDLQTTLERRDMFEAASNAKDQKIQQLEQEAGGLRRKVEEYATLEGNLRDEILGLESTLFETRTRLSVTQEDASRSTTLLAISQITRTGLLAQITSLESLLAQHQAESGQELSDLRSAQALSLAEKQTRVFELESSLAVAGSSIAELQERLTIITSSVEDERNILQTKISSLQQSLEESNGAVGRLGSSDESSRLALQNVTKELDVLQAQFVAEAQHSAALADALEEAQGRMQTAEKEIATMEVEKKADEEAVRLATTIYSKLRRLHAECLTEMDGLVGIIQESGNVDMSKETKANGKDGMEAFLILGRPI